MGRFGEELRREREARGIALETITNSTKISSRHLCALEGEQFDRLPGGVFNRGIVRGYARVVGLDEETWVDRFTSAYHASGMVIQDDADWTKFAENVVNRRTAETDLPTMRLRWAGVVLLVMLIAGLGWFVYHFVREKASEHGSRSMSPNATETYVGDAIFPAYGDPAVEPLSIVTSAFTTASRSQPSVVVSWETDPLFGRRIAFAFTASRYPAHEARQSAPVEPRIFPLRCKFNSSGQLLLPANSTV